MNIAIRRQLITLYEVEDELQESEKSDIDADPVGHIQMDEDTDLEAYFDEPLADDVWQEEYRRRKKKTTLK